MMKKETKAENGFHAEALQSVAENIG